MAEADNRFFCADNIKRKALPFVFTVTAAAAIINVYRGNYADIYVLPAALLTLIFFAVYDFINSHRKLGVPIYIVLTVGIFTLIGAVMQGINPIEFTEWFLTGGATIDTLPQYIFAIVLGFTFFISSVAYYFTHIIYRVSVLTLVSLIPCAIYVKSSQSVPAFYSVLLAAINIFIYISCNLNNFKKDYIVVGKRASVTSYIDFSLAAVLIAVLLPKPSETPFYEKFEDFTNHFTIAGHEAIFSGEYTEHSGNADDYNLMETTVLYLVSADAPQYMKIQTFDSYDTDNRYWVYEHSPLLSGYSDWEETENNKNFSALLQAYIAYDSDIISDISDTQREALLSAEEKHYSAFVTAVDFPAVFILAPERINGIYFSSRENETTLRTSNGEVFPNSGSLRSNESYTLGYYDSDFVRSSGWISSGLCNISYDDFGTILLNLYYDSKNAGDTEISDTVDAFFDEYYNAGSEKYINADISEEIQQISDEITKGLTYDWEKAEAIEEYFQTDGFIYDLAYKAPEELDTPEYFLTESKRGTCSDFATAFSLLARAAGLRTRYDEGFIFGEQISERTYQITTEEAHAFPEVYISGAGWVIYEPTVSGTVSSSGANGENFADADYLAIFIVCIAVFVSLLAVVALVLFMPKLEEAAFCVKVKFSSPEKGIILVYGRLAKQCRRRFDIPSDKMTAEQLSDFVAERTETPVSDITEPFERVCYGEKFSDRLELLSAYKCYKLQMKLLSKSKAKVKS